MPVSLTEIAEDLRRDFPPSLTRDENKPADAMGRCLSALLPLALLFIGLATTGVGFWLLQAKPGIPLAPAACVAGPFLVVSAAAVQLGVARERRLEQAEDAACREDCLDLYWALDTISDRDLKGLAWVNYKQLRTFASIAQRQARMSFYASLAAAAISLLVLTSIASVAVGLPTTPGKVVAGFLATAGSVLSGFLTKTFLRSYQLASQQMSYYYGQPLVHCYLLHAERLAFEVGEETGEEERLLLRRVIDASIKAAADAQHHLLTMQEHAPGSAHRRRAPRPEQAPAPDPLGPLDPLPGLEHLLGGRPTR
jgi:hypothetical protein